MIQGSTLPRGAWFLPLPFLLICHVAFIRNLCANIHKNPGLYNSRDEKVRVFTSGREIFLLRREIFLLRREIFLLRREIFLLRREIFASDRVENPTKYFF